MTHSVKNFKLLNEISPKLDVPSNIQLFDHQKSMIYRMCQIEHENSSSNLTSLGTLCDPPGSGKSFAILSVILREKRRLGKSQNLIIIPPNLLSQWVDYVQRFSNELTYRFLTEYGQVTQLYFDARALFAADIIFTTSLYYPAIQSTVTQIKAWFNRTIIDEVDSISFFTESAIPSKIVWLVSASIDQLSMGAYKGFKQSNVVKCDPSYIEKSIRLPKINEKRHLCHNPYVDLLKGMIPKLDSVNALDFSNFKFNYLRNENVQTAKDLISALFRDSSLELEGVVESIPQLEAAVRWDPMNPTIQASLQSALENRKRLMIRLGVIFEKINNKICPICVEPFSFEKEGFTTPCCSATFCHGCIEKWLTRSPKCVRCFKKLKIEDMISVQASGNGELVQKGFDKTEQFAQILDQERMDPNFRALVFSDYQGTFRHILPILEEKGIKHAEIEGGQKSMDKAIDDFTSGEKPILLIDSIQYGAGMNLEVTSSVYILHRTPREEQIVGRAQRIGRTTSLNVHHFLYNNELYAN